MNQEIEYESEALKAMVLCGIIHPQSSDSGRKYPGMRELTVGGVLGAVLPCATILADELRR